MTSLGHAVAVRGTMRSARMLRGTGPAFDGAPPVPLAQAAIVTSRTTLIMGRKDSLVDGIGLVLHMKGLSIILADDDDSFRPAFRSPRPSHGACQGGVVRRGKTWFAQPTSCRRDRLERGVGFPPSDRTRARP